MTAKNENSMNEQLAKFMNSDTAKQAADDFNHADSIFQKYTAKMIFRLYCRIGFLRQMHSLTTRRV